MSDFLDAVLKLDEDVARGDEGVMGGITTFYDTGSYSLNAQISGSIYGGYPNKISGLAGEPATGKTFFALQACELHLNKSEHNVVVYFESEAGLTNDMLKDKGVGVKNFIHFPVVTVQEFRNKCVKVLEHWERTKNKGKLFIVLDSLGGLSTIKEIEDIEGEKDTRDMTKAQLIKGAFRVLDMKLAKLDVPLLVTNHVYAKVGCLDDKQTIVMSDNSFKNITEITVGDSVLTQDGPKNVSEIFEYDVDEYHEITLEDGLIIKATPNHKFKLSNGKWKRADEITIEDDFMIIK